MKYLATALVAPLLLSACMDTAPATPAPADPADECGAAALQYLVGQPQSALAAMTFPDSTRFIGPDTMVTLDFRPDRLNIAFDAAGIITSVTCT